MPNFSEAQFACSEYGIHARENFLGNCECSYGYVWGEDFLGDPVCVSENQWCQDQYGYNAQSSLGGGCECRYGYVVDENIFGEQECVDGDKVCRDDHGYYSSYDNLSKKCECDSGYTLDDGYQCVEKHNSAYFILLDISDDGDELLVQSQYDYQNYIIEYGIGCWDYAIESYEGLSLVINMGRDFTVDIFDTLVLPNHDQDCSIMSVDWTNDNFFPEPEEDDYSSWSSLNSYFQSGYIVSSVESVEITTPTSAPVPPLNVQEIKTISVEEFEVDDKIETFEIENAVDIATSGSSTIQVEFVAQNETAKPSLMRKAVNFFESLLAKVKSLF